MSLPVPFPCYNGTGRKVRHMKAMTGNKRDIIEKAVREFSDGKYPFIVETDGDRLVFRWRWMDATVFGISSISREVKEFRHVVILGNDGTFYGYDTDDGSYAGARFSGKVRAGGSTFTGQEIRIRREAAFGKDRDGAGIRTWEFSTEDVHGPVRKFFTDNGWRYRAPMATWVGAEGTQKKKFLWRGLLFTAISAVMMIPFLLEGEIFFLVFSLLFLAPGIWMFLVGTGRAKIPAFSVKGAIMATALVFAAAYLAIFIGLGIYYIAMGGLM